MIQIDAGYSLKGRTMSMAPRSRASVQMNASKTSYAEPSPSDDDDSVDQKDLYINFKKARDQQIEDKKNMIEAMKSEYGELKDAKDLLYVSFEEPKPNREPITFDKDSYKKIL